MKATNKKDSEGWETEPSHAHCPHASSGPPANLHYLPFRFLGNSWRAFFKAVFIFSPSLFFPAPRLLEWRVCALSWSQTPSGRQKMMLVWTISQNMTESLHGSAAMRTRHCRVSAEICDDEGTRLKLVICISRLFGENYYRSWLIKQKCQDSDSSLIVRICCFSLSHASADCL